MFSPLHTHTSPESGPTAGRLGPPDPATPRPLAPSPGVPAITTASATRAATPVPNEILDRLLIAAANDAGHLNLCIAAQGAVNSRPAEGRHSHPEAVPGDRFGAVLAWLWTSGQEERAAHLVGDYLTQIRSHQSAQAENPLVLADLLDGLSLSVSPERLDYTEIDRMADCLREHVPPMFRSSVS